MTNVRRTSISFPKDLSERIYAMRKDDPFTRCSYSELVRILAEMGLETLEKSRETASGGAR